MTTENWIQLGCGELGFLMHSAMKFSFMQKQAVKANAKFTLKDYLNQDAGSLALSFLSPILWLGLFGEAVQKYPELKTFSRTSFAVMGALGSYLAQYFLSVAQKRINGIIDIKTNLADESTNTPKTPDM